MNPLEALAPFQGHSNLLLILAPAVQSPAYEEQMNQFAGLQDKCEAQALVVGALLYEGESRIGRMMLDEGDVQALRRHFGVSDDGFLAVLVDKSGAVRKRYEAPVASGAVFAALDAGIGHDASVEKDDA